MRKIAEYIVDDLVDKRIEEWGLHSYGSNMRSAIKNAIVQELKARDILMTREEYEYDGA